MSPEDMKIPLVQVIVLGSLDADIRRAAQLMGSQLRYWPSSDRLKDACEALDLARLEASSLLPGFFFDSSF